MRHFRSWDGMELAYRLVGSGPPLVCVPGGPGQPWNAAAQAHAAAEPAQFAQPATDGFYAGFEPDPNLPERLAALTVPVMLVAGEYDIWPTCTAVRELAALLRNAEVAVLPRAGHFPWVDDPAAFTATVQGFLARRPV
jgi:pimeloyl-ACP methyl ester carboxylesterase